MSSASQPFFSVIIPTLNEEQFLPELLQDLADQTLQDFEVIHVDGHSDDATQEVAKKFTESCRLQTIEADKRNVSVQRNLGGKRARGTWLIFMDADNRLPKHFLEGFKYYLSKNPETDLATTLIELPDDTNHASIIRLLNFGTEFYQAIGQDSAFGAMIGCHSKVFEKIQFDPSQALLEDIYFVRAAKKAGFIFRIMSDPRYRFSLRRLEREGSLKLASATAIMQIKALRGKHFSEPLPLYPMSGGTDYQPSETSRQLFRRLNSILKDASSRPLSIFQKFLP